MRWAARYALVEYQLMINASDIQGNDFGESTGATEISDAAGNRIGGCSIFTMTLDDQDGKQHC